MPEQNPASNPAPARKMKPETKALIAYILAGILAGILSWMVGKLMPTNSGPFAALAIAIFILVGLPQLLKRPFGASEKLKWWLSNGGYIYIFVWFITWIIFYNLV